MVDVTIADRQKLTQGMSSVSVVLDRIAANAKGIDPDGPAGDTEAAVEQILSSVQDMKEQLSALNDCI